MKIWRRQRCAQIFQKKVKGRAVEKGVAFPTCVNVNECVCYNSPLESEADVQVRPDLPQYSYQCLNTSIPAHTNTRRTTVAPATATLQPFAAPAAALAASERRLRPARLSTPSQINCHAHVHTPCAHVCVGGAHAMTAFTGGDAARRAGGRGAAGGAHSQHCVAALCAHGRWRRRPRRAPVPPYITIVSAKKL